MESSRPIQSPPLLPRPRAKNPFRGQPGLREDTLFQKNFSIELLDMVDPSALNNQAIKLLKTSTGKRLVIAIEIGYYESGYARQFRSDFELDRLSIHINTKWSSVGFCSFKTPTALLLKPDMSVAEFGGRADERYSTLKEEEDDWGNWYFFREFTRVLHAKGNSIDSNTTVEDAKGRHLPASLIFGKSMQFMKDHAITNFKEAGVPYIEDATKWVITIPAICTDRAKGLMRKAATEVAGIPADNLTIALEPECAAIYCYYSNQLIPYQLEIDRDSCKLHLISTQNSVLIVLDTGEGISDATTIHVGEKGQMEHVQMSGGGPWGGMRIDDKFFTMLRELIGQDVVDEFVRENEMDSLDLRIDFETQRREVKHPTDSDSNPRFRLRVPDSLKTLWEKKKHKTISEIMKEDHIRDKDIKFTSSRLTFPTKIIQDMFDEGVQELMNLIQTIAISPNIKGLPITAVIDVGRISMSSYMSEALRQELGKKNIQFVPCWQPAVLFGAVLFGHREDIIASHIMPHTIADITAASLSKLCFYEMDDKTVACVFL